MPINNEEGTRGLRQDWHFKSHKNLIFMLLVTFVSLLNILIYARKSNVVQNHAKCTAIYKGK